MSLTPITLYSHYSGPNPWKVAIILEELGLPFETKFLEFPEMKQDLFLSKNPNGRVPAIFDPNTDITLFESGAIISYLIDQYDKEGKLHYDSFREKYQTLSWQHFQMSGQGPYFGQKAWFTHLHAEKISSAIERYGNEVKRVVGVIDAHLKKAGTEYLIGNKVTYADLMFVMWSSMVPWLGPELDLSAYDSYDAWLKKLLARPAVEKTLKAKAAISQQ